MVLSAIDETIGLEDLAVYDTADSVEPFPYETPMSQSQYEVVTTHTTMAENDTGNIYEVPGMTVYDGAGIGGSHPLFYQYVPSKVCG